ncbi:MAG: sulfotransferase [Chloroflexota bacterium]
MLVLSVGMPRAGSGWHYNLVHDLIVANGGQDARQIRARYRLQSILTEVNCNMGSLAAHRLGRVLIPALLGNQFTVKLHGGPKPVAKLLIRLGFIKPIYIYRDPRAALLSAFEYGQRGGSGFKHLADIDAAIKFMAPYLQIWDAWTAMPNVLAVRYEDMLSDYPAEIERLLAFLSVDKGDAKVAEVVARYQPGKSSAEDKGQHFHKGDAQRFRSALTDQQLAAAQQAFGAHLTKMGYQI